MRRILTLAASAAMAVGLYAAPAPADPPTQEGLVNVNVSGMTIQVPVAAAVNICDVNVAALAEIADQGGSCDAQAGSQAQA